MDFSTFFSCMKPWSDSYASKGLASYYLWYNITGGASAIKKGVTIIENQEPHVPQRFAKYTLGNSIRKVSHDVRGTLSTDVFAKYLAAQASGETMRKDLFRLFSEKKDQIKAVGVFDDPANLFNDIAETFAEIINDAAEAYKPAVKKEQTPETKPNHSFSDDLQKEVLNIVTDTRIALEEIIEAVKNLAVKQDFRQRTPRPGNEQIRQYREELETRRTRFKELNEKLYSYSVIYPHLTKLRQAGDLFETVCDKIESCQKSRKEISTFDTDIRAYSVCLDEILREICGVETITDNFPIQLLP